MELTGGFYILMFDCHENMEKKTGEFGTPNAIVTVIIPKKGL
jgi:hypothetical protein